MTGKPELDSLIKIKSEMRLYCLIAKGKLN